MRHGKREIGSIRRRRHTLGGVRIVVGLFLAAALGCLGGGAAWAQEDFGKALKEFNALIKELRVITGELKVHLPPLRIVGGEEVHGQVIASYKGIEKAFLTVPDVEVYIENVGTGAESPHVKTDLGGTYVIPKQPAGTYRVCWKKPGWYAECMDKSFLLKNATAYPGLIRIRPEADARKRGLYRGHVALADGGSCWFDQEFFDLEETASVELVELITGTVKQQIRANDHGDFVLTGVPTTTPFQVRTKCGKEIVRSAVFPNLADLSGIFAAQIVVPDHRPHITTVYAADAGKRIRRAPVGATVEVQAEVTDGDNDALRFDWRVLNGAGSLAPSTTEKVKWTLPAQPGRYNLYVVVDDGRGGRHMKRLLFDVGIDTVLFGGTVVGSDGPPVAKASVTVNGDAVTADANGNFRIKVPAADSYVLHIEAEGYVELGRRLQTEMPGNTWVMTKAFAQAIDPGKDNVIVDGRKDWIRPDPDKEQEKRPRRPSRLTIFANTLIGVDGTAPVAANGPFTAYFATIDSNTELLPGDYSAVDSGGNKVFMQSAGAAFIDVRDATGRKYRLRPDATALLGGAVQAPQLNNAGGVAPNIDVFSYDPKSGAWIQDEPSAALVGGNVYEVKLTKFSTKNFDQSKPNPACLRVTVDQGILDLGNVRARVDVATGSDSVERRETELDVFDNAFYNMPLNAPFTIEVFQGAPPGDQLIFADVGNTGGSWGGTGEPPAPYLGCKAHVTLTFPTQPPAFLQYSKGTGSLAKAQGYYAAIAATTDKPTLGQWWGANGFDPVDGSGGTRTSFLNHNDLGFGRDMHCRSNGAIGAIGDPIAGNVDIACYVTNYGEPNQEIGNANLAETADTATAVATVAMEYSAVAGQNPNNRIVKFYVYLGGQASGALTEAADLDKAGPKFVPNLCEICHGGNYNPADQANPTFDEVNLGSSFREFDAYSFKFPGSNPQAAQEADFLTQNTMVYHSKPSPPIQEVIKAFYAGGATIDQNAVPTGWFLPPAAVIAPQEDLYLKIVGKSCRTCHVAQPAYNPLVAPLPLDTYPSWATYEQFRDNRSLVYALACSVKAMPNALVTFKNFWLSLGPHRPDYLGSFTDAGTGWQPALGACDP